MNFINKIINKIKSLFSDKNKMKMLPQTELKVEKDERAEFISSIRVKLPSKKSKNKVETMVCKGDGLGIQKKMGY